jgi:AcrR family transcriptional regulator
VTDLLETRQREAAVQVVDALLEAGRTDLSVEELRAVAGISKRTFHRWFPAKERVIRPFYAAVTDRFTTAIRALDAATTTGIADAWEREVLGPDADRSVALFRLIAADPAYWSVFLEVLQDGEREIAEALGATAGDMSALEATVAAVAVVASSRLALAAAAAESAADPAEAFTTTLRAFDPIALR